MPAKCPQHYRECLSSNGFPVTYLYRMSESSYDSCFPVFWLLLLLFYTVFCFSPPTPYLCLSQSSFSCSSKVSPPLLLVGSLPMDRFQPVIFRFSLRGNERSWTLHYSHCHINIQGALAVQQPQLSIKVSQ